MKASQQIRIDDAGAVSPPEIQIIGSFTLLAVCLYLVTEDG